MNKTVTLHLNILNFSSFLQYQRFIMPISFLFYISNGLTFSDFVFFQSIFNITCLISKIPMGFLGDIFPKKHLIIISYLMFTLRVLLWIFFSGFWVILAGEILYGLFKALFRGNVDSYIYELLKKNNIEAKMMSGYGKLSLYTSIGSALSCIAGAILYKYTGFKTILILELVFQIVAVILLCFIPNIPAANKPGRTFTQHLNDLRQSILSTITNEKINYLVYYSAFLTGMTTVFVWNFQPLLKYSHAPVILFGVVSFVNQLLRGIGGACANFFVKLFKTSITKIEYMFVILAFLMILSAYKVNNYIFSALAIFIVSAAIMLFVVFNIYTVSKIHANTPDASRASTSSTSTFWGDFSAFIMLISFKFLYDGVGLKYTLLIFFLLAMILLFPRRSHNSV